ncbi:MAG TPA: hypothetical protein VFN71_09485 [Methylomirabilota bacterium]|nr:hypothetical protein [Methylomirabilota bacterium]
MRQAIGPPPSTSFPDAHLLYVIRPAEVGLYEHLRRSLGALQDVRVIMERRGTERRRQVRQVSHERRRVERRRRREEVHHLGYAVVRFGAPAGARGSQQPGTSAVPPSVSPSG